LYRLDRGSSRGVTVSGDWTCPHAAGRCATACWGVSPTRHCRGLLVNLAGVTFIESTASASGRDLPGPPATAGWPWPSGPGRWRVLNTAGAEDLPAYPDDATEVARAPGAASHGRARAGWLRSHSVIAAVPGYIVAPGAWWGGYGTELRSTHALPGSRDRRRIRRVGFGMRFARQEGPGSTTFVVPGNRAGTSGGTGATNTYWGQPATCHRSYIVSFGPGFFVVLCIRSLALHGRGAEIGPICNARVSARLGPAPDAFGPRVAGRPDSTRTSAAGT